MNEATREPDDTDLGQWADALACALVGALAAELTPDQRQRAADRLCDRMADLVGTQELPADQDEAVSQWLAQALRSLDRG